MRYLRSAAVVTLVLVSSAAWADMSLTPNSLVYGPLPVGIDPGSLPDPGALPPGTGAAVMAFARLLGIFALGRSLSIVYHMGESRHEGKGIGAAAVFFAGGVLVFHIDKTMGMLAATFPGFPNLSSVLQL